MLNTNNDNSDRFNIGKCHLVIMSPPVGLGNILFLPCPSICLSQNRVRSVTQKPFKIFS